MATQLSVYNGALAELKEPGLVTLSDSRSARRELDRHWDAALEHMIEQGLWKFAKREVLLSPLADDVVGFGYNYSFTRPTDYVRIIAISANERFEPTLEEFEEYSDESGDYFRAYTSAIYLKYVSNDDDWGKKESKWTPAFVRALEFELALRAGPKISRLMRDDKLDLKKDARRALMDAQTKDAFNQPAKRLPVGRLIQTRGNPSRGPNAMRKIGYPGG